MKNKILTFVLVYILILITVSFADIQVYFSPNGGASIAILEQIDNAANSIDIAIYSFTSESLTEAILKARDRGVRIRVLMDRTQAGGKYSQYKFLLDNGIDVILDRHAGIMHNKIAVIDNRVLITGSYNWTASAEERNEENLLIFIEEEEIIKIYQERLDYLFAYNEGEFALNNSENDNSEIIAVIIFVMIVTTVFIPRAILGKRRKS